MKLFTNESIDVVCAVIFNEDDTKVLVGKRKDVKLWEFPGGRVEGEETYYEAVVREIKEELDVDIHVYYYRGCEVKEVQGKTINLYVFYAQIESGVPTPIEHDELRWVYAEEMDKLDWIESKELVEHIKGVLTDFNV